MNQYYLALDYIKRSFEGAPFVNTITQGMNVPDMDKMTIFPLVHINIESGNLTDSGVATFRFTIECLDVRNMSKEIITDKFLGNDNEIDNLNCTFGILNYAISKMRLTNDENNIELIAVTEPTPILLQYTSALDGWRMEVTVSVPNNICVCCDE
jgi:hypothetical protein